MRPLSLPRRKTISLHGWMICTQRTEHRRMARVAAHIRKSTRTMLNYTDVHGVETRVPRSGNAVVVPKPGDVI